MGTHSRHCRQTKGVGRQLGPVGHPVSKISPKGHPAISARWSVGGVQKGTSRLVGGAKRLVPDPRWRRLNPPQLGCPHSLTFLNSPGRPYTFAPCGPFEGRILLALVSIKGNTHLHSVIITQLKKSLGTNRVRHRREQEQPPHPSARARATRAAQHEQGGQ